ncbi:RsmD family RNA methyltransferase [Fluviispira multicolorata]|nr:RsmD family RNA methyltransferase [Fluviispira multicolorata]
MSKQSTKHLSANLSLAKGLRFRIGDNGNIYASISSSSGEFYVAPEVLTFLCFLADNSKVTDTTAIPNKIKKHYNSLLNNIPNSEECAELLNDLIAAGVIINTSENSSRYLQEDGFGDPWIQWAMLSDSVRSNSYYSAIKQEITAQSVVLDVGAGTGLLSAQALSAGAKKVIAIEETKTAESIKAIFTKLGLETNSKNFILHNTNSYDVELTDTITMVVSELFGNDPFQEGVIPTLREIGSRFVGSNITYIPSKVTVYCNLIELNNHPMLHRIKALNKLKTKSLSENFLDKFMFAAASKLNLNNISFPIALNSQNFKYLSKTVEIGSTRLDPPPVYSSDLSKHPLYGKKEIEIEEDCDNILAIIWFRVHLTKSITISSNPKENDACEHWSPIAIPLNKIISKQDKVEIKYQLSEQENLICCDIFHKSEKIGSR